MRRRSPPARSHPPSAGSRPVGSDPGGSPDRPRSGGASRPRRAGWRTRARPGSRHARGRSAPPAPARHGCHRRGRRTTEGAAQGRRACDPRALIPRAHRQPRVLPTHPFEARDRRCVPRPPDRARGVGPRARRARRRAAAGAPAWPSSRPGWSDTRRPARRRAARGSPGRPRGRRPRPGTPPDPAESATTSRRRRPRTSRGRRRA